MTKNCFRNFFQLKSLEKAHIAHGSSFVQVENAELLGRGVFARTRIPEGMFLGTYQGELIDIKQCEERVFSGKGLYIIHLGDEKFIDGQVGGNWTSLINHSKQFNVVAISDVPSQSIKIYTKKVIGKGQQLFLNYGDSWFEYNKIREL